MDGSISVWVGLVLILLAFGLGYGFSLIRHSKRAIQLTLECEKMLAERVEIEKKLDSLTNQLDGTRVALHQKEVTIAGLSEQLNAANKQALILQTSQEQALKQIQELETLVSDYRERVHQAEVAIERASSETVGVTKRAESLEAALRDQLDETRRMLVQSHQDYQALNTRFQDLSRTHTELKTTLEQREQQFAAQMQQLSEAKSSLTKEFENLASRIFEEKGKAFTQSTQVGLEHLLKPFREQIDGFQKRINEVHDASNQGQARLDAEIRKVLEIGLRMSKEANNLTSALKGDSQQRGAWGEAQLRRTLEMSGLVEEAHFEAQTSFKDVDGKQKQTDYLIKLPDGKHIIIDSKVTLNAYDRVVSADTPEAYELAMAEHLRAVRKHIDDLASKDYANLIGMKSPSFVLMFMPIEAAYIEALKHTKDLFEYGYNKGIVLVSHTTLIPILRTVSNLWMIERSNTQAREISDKAGEIYNQVSIIAERLAKLGGTLNTASRQFNSTVKALAGQQGLYGKVERFSKLSTKVTKSLPHLEPVAVDYDTEKLTLIPIAEVEPA